MNVLFAVYDLTGRIKRTGSAPLSMVGIQAQEGERVVSVFEQVDQATQYVSDLELGTIATKPELGAVIDKTVVNADGIDSVTISGLPIPTDYRLSGPVQDSAEIDDGSITLRFHFAGDYSIELRALNRMAQTITLSAR